MKDNQIKILHILQSLNLQGGTPRKIFWLAKNSRYQHIIFYSGNKKKERNFGKDSKFFIDNNIFLIIPNKYDNFFTKITSLVKIIKQEKISIIQANFNRDYIIGGILKLLLPKIKFVTTFVGSDSPPSKIKCLFISFFLELSNFNIFVSEFVKKSKLKTYKSLSKKNNKVIYNGVLPLSNTPTLNKIKKNILLTTISGLNHYKNLFLLIDIMSILIKDNNKFRLDIIGEGPLRSNLEKYIISKQLTTYIRILGYQNNVKIFLNRTDIYIHPAHKEGFGLAVIEAMSTRLPVILSNAGALPELIENNHSGLLADPFNPQDWADKIKYLIDNKTEMERLGTNAYNKVKHSFSLEKYINGHDTIYYNLISARK